MSQPDAYAIVMRMQGLSPANLASFEKHRLRRGGDLGHVDKSRSNLNRPLIGRANWAVLALNEIGEMRVANFANELDGLKRRRRKAELKRRLAEGPRDPWRPTRHGPMREVILTANRKWFDTIGAKGEAQFEERAVVWLRENFGDDVVHARADLDEQAYHIHAVILPRAIDSKGRQVLQPSKHPLIRSYEMGQDSVGDWFAEIGLKRGEKRKQAVRTACIHNAQLRAAIAEGMPEEDLPEPMALPAYRQHVSPRKWREAQEIALAKRETEATAREAMAGAREARLEATKADQQDRDVALSDREVAVNDRERTADARDTQLDASEQAQRDRDAAVATRENAVSAREQKAASKQQTAQAMINIADRVAKGDLDVPEQTDEAAKTANDPVRLDRHQAATLFARALAKLRQQAKTEARAEARAELSETFAEIKAADEAIVRVATLLPPAAREAIAKARRSLSIRIMALGQMAKRQFLNRDAEKDR